MKTITKYQASDGVEFYDQNKCEEYEVLILKVDLIMSALPPIPNDDGCNFANGGGFIQHNKTALRSAKVELLKLMKTKIDHHWIDQTIADDNAHPSYVDRLLGDYNIKPLSKAWYRFYCCDNQYREWGQPYYASNPDKGTQKQINP